MRALGIAFALLLAGSGLVYADGMKTVVSATSVNPEWTVVVYNDSGSELTSGTVVAWDNDDTEFDRSGYPYVTTSTTADFVWTAGVLIDPTCRNGDLCNMQVYGPAKVRIANASTSGTLAEDTLVAQSTVAGQADDATVGADTCVLGRLMEMRHADTGGTLTSGTVGTDNSVAWVLLNITCATSAS